MKSMSSHTIAVIDDEKEILQNYVELLHGEYEVSAFDTPYAFLNALEDPRFRRPDLVITDLKMPGLDGLEMIRLAQQKDHYFPVILLSGFLNKAKAIEAVDIGIYRLLEKPTSFETLRGAIDQLLLEGEMEQVRREIRVLTSQLRELYSSLRVAVLPHLPQDTLNRMIVEAQDGQVKRHMSFDDLLEGLESRLDRLLKMERVLNELRQRRYSV